MNTQFDPLSFSIEKLLPQGIFILAGSGKIGKLHLAISSLGISDGFIQQIKEFLSTNPRTKRIVIDTLERIRNTD